MNRKVSRETLYWPLTVQERSFADGTVPEPRCVAATAWKRDSVVIATKHALTRNHGGRSMGIVRFALRFPHTFYVLAALILFLGSIAIRTMPTDIFPEIRIPVVTVIWQY